MLACRSLRPFSVSPWADTNSTSVVLHGEPCDSQAHLHSVTHLRAGFSGNSPRPPSPTSVVLTYDFQVDRRFSSWQTEVVARIRELWMNKEHWIRWLSKKHICWESYIPRIVYAFLFWEVTRPLNFWQDLATLPHAYRQDRGMSLRESDAYGGDRGENRPRRGCGGRGDPLAKRGMATAQDRCREGREDGYIICIYILYTFI